MSRTINSTRQLASLLRRKESMRYREIAEKLGISEGELISAYVGMEIPPLISGELRVVRLRSEWHAIINSIASLGNVMALTRNSSCVIEKVGIYKNAAKEGNIGFMIGEIDLRIFYQEWAHAFAVREMSKEGMQCSLQFFDKSGVAIHKVHMRSHSEIEKFNELVLLYQAGDQFPGITAESLKQAILEIDDSEIDAIEFRREWSELVDTHDFFKLLKKYKVTRTQALRLGAPQFSEQIHPSCIQDLLELVSSTQIPVMIFVGNVGMIQIYTGSIQKVVKMSEWINVMDPNFNLHLRLDCIVSAWIVRKPTKDGVVTSVECFDLDGQPIALFFGERKPGNPELESWRNLIDTVLVKFNSNRIAA